MAPGRFVEVFYDPKRRHSTLGYVGPMRFEETKVLRSVSTEAAAAQPCPPILPDATQTFIKSLRMMEIPSNMPINARVRSNRAEQDSLFSIAADMNRLDQHRSNIEWIQADQRETDKRSQSMFNDFARVGQWNTSRLSANHDKGPFLLPQHLDQSACTNALPERKQVDRRISED